MTNSLSSFWRKLRVLSPIFATIIIPIAIAFITQSYTKSIKESEIGVQYIRIAINILQEPPSNEIISLREWAIDVIDHYSDVPLNQDARTELRKNKIYIFRNVLKHIRRKIEDDPEIIHEDIFGKGPIDVFAQ